MKLDAGNQQTVTFVWQDPPLLNSGRLRFETMREFDSYSSRRFCFVFKLLEFPERTFEATLKVVCLLLIKIAAGKLFYKSKEPPFCLYKPFACDLLDKLEIYPCTFDLEVFYINNFVKWRSCFFLVKYFYKKIFLNK